MSQAPGLSGTPDSGHCSSAATRASCARSSASPTSRTMRVRPAMSLGDSILQTASMVRCMSVAVTTTDHIIFNPAAQVEALRLCRPTIETFRPEHLTNLSLAFPARPVFLVELHKLNRRFDCFFLRFQLKLRVAPDDLLSLGERPISHDHLSSRNPDAGAQRGRAKSPAAEHRARFCLLFGSLRYSIHQFLGRRCLLLSVLDNHHESHR